MAEGAFPPADLLAMKEVSVVFQARGRRLFGSVPIYALTGISL